LTLTRAAERIGIERKTLSDLEHGKRHPYEPTLAKIARGYQIPVEDLVILEEDPPKENAPRSPGRPRSEDLLEDEGIAKWLRSHGHRDREEFVAWAEGLADDLDNMGRPIGIMSGLDEMRETRDYLIGLVRYNRSAQRELFSVDEEDPVRAALARERLAWKLSWEIRHEYAAREVELMNFSKRLYAAGEISLPIVYEHRMQHFLDQLPEDERERVIELANQREPLRVGV
jgi:transcriptional regulator with XRE-family HTH domain